MDLMDSIFKTALDTWNWCIQFAIGWLRSNPETLYDGQMWSVAKTLHSVLLPVAYSLLVVWFLWGLISSVSSLKELRNLEHVAGNLLRLAIAKTLVEASLDITLMIIGAVQGVVDAFGGSAYGSPDIITAVDASSLKDVLNITIWQDPGKWLVVFALCLLFLLASIGCGISVLLIVISRFYRLFIYVIFAPIPISSFASPDPAVNGIAKHYLKSLMGICFQAAVIYLSVMLYPVFLTLFSTGMFPISDTLIAVFCQTIFYEVLLLTLIKASDQIVKELGFV